MRWLSQTTYWTGSGLSSPIWMRVCSIAAGSRSSPKKTSAGSAGDRRTRMKTPTVTRNATGIIRPRRRRMYRVTTSPSCLRNCVALCLDLARLEHHRDVGREQLRLDELRELERRRSPRRDEQLELERSASDVGDELLGALRVGLGPRFEARVVCEVRGRDRSVTDEADPLRRAS